MLEVARKPNISQPASGKTAKSLVNTNHRVATIGTNDAALELDRSRRADPGLVYQTKLPVITGEVNYKGTMPVDGILTGRLGHNGGAMEVRQKSRPKRASQPELSGEISFRDMVRINGHIAGTVYSEHGTLIIDSGATVDSKVDVAVAVVRGTVNGDIVAQQRIELGPSAKVFGNIWTRSISVEVGAVFDGVCTML